MYKWKTQSGLSLIEMIMVLVIVSIMSIMIMTYYRSVQQTKKVNQAMQLIEQVMSVTDNYRHPMSVQVIDGVRTVQSGNRFVFQGLDANVIAHSGFLPQQYIRYTSGGKASITTPWFGDTWLDVYGAGMSTGKFRYQIQLFNIPDYGCETLATRLRALQTKTNVPAGYHNDKYNQVVGCSNNTLTIKVYPVSTD